MTDTITLPREVVEEVLEALAKTPCNSVYEQDCTPCNAEEALRAALAAEPTKPEPVAVFDEQMGHPVLLLGSPMLKDKQPLYTAPPDAEALRRDAERYRWMKQEVKRIPPSWGLIGWDAAIDAAMGDKT